jgi:methionyl-tRNA synthetase
MSAKNFYLTTPIYYVNARPHIGHAYTTIVADVLARRHRLLGDDTFFLTGTDEHGQKIERSAAAAGIPPQQFADQVSKSFEDLWKRMGITNDAYIRTTDAAHAKGVQKLFRTLYEKNFIELRAYTGTYCVSDEAFVDVPAGTPCPDCGRITETITEENFFFKLSEFQKPLIDLIESGDLIITPESARNEVLSFIRGNFSTVATETYDRLVAEGIEKPDTFKVAEEDGHLKKSSGGHYYVPGALKDLSISRSSFTWGIPVPEPAASTAKEKHVIYVWLDALANYITALGYGSDDETNFKKFWPADLHLVGKEITRFHCVYWPAFLLAADLPLPKQITAHGWLLFDNSKMSKSKGNIVRTETILDAFGTLCPPPAVDTTSVPQRLKPEGEDGVGGTAEAVPLTSAADRDLFAADVLRYYLLREIPFGQDGSFSFDSLITRYNADLANGYGNLVSRTLKLCSDYFANGFSKSYPARFSNALDDNEVDVFLRDLWYVGMPYESGLDDLNTLEELVDAKLQENNFAAALTEIFALIRKIDMYLANEKPWMLAKLEDEHSQDKLEEVLYVASEAIRYITALLYPIFPYATARVWAQLGLGDIEQSAANGDLKNLQWGGLQPGTKLGTLGPIFPRADKGLAQIMTDMENPTPATTPTTDPDAPPRSGAPDAAPLPVAGSHATTSGPDASLTPAEPAPHPASPSLESPQITIDDFAKIDLRVAQIVLAERIPKADKLLRLEVDLGPLGRRQILSGIAEFYTPEELTGRRIVVITNLAPRKMRGLESHGMLLAASDGDHGKPHLATCGDEIPLGSRLK